MVWEIWKSWQLKSCHHAEMHYECTVLADVAPPLKNWLRLQQTFPSQFHKCHQMLWRRGEWTLGPQTTPLSLVDLCHCLLIFMFWALLGGLSFCRHCIIRPQGLVWSEDYLTFISPSHLNQFLTFYENLWQMILLKLAKHIELCWNMIADFYSQLMTCLGLFH